MILPSQSTNLAKVLQSFGMDLGSMPKQHSSLDTAIQPTTKGMKVFNISIQAVPFVAMNMDLQDTSSFNAMLVCAPMLIETASFNTLN